MLRDQSRNFLFNYLGRNEDKTQTGLSPDCADFVYFLRAYFDASERPWFAVDTVIAVKWNFYCFVSRWHKSVLEVRAAASSPRATARPFGQRGLTPPPASNQGPACDRRLDVAQQPIANAGSKGLPVFRTPKHRTNNLRIAATTICLGLSRPRAFNRVTSATIAGLYRIADIAGM